MTGREAADLLGEVARRTALDAVTTDGITHPEDIVARVSVALAGAALALTVLAENRPNR